MKRSLFAIIATFFVTVIAPAAMIAGQEISHPDTFRVAVQDDCEVGELVRATIEGDVAGITWRVIPETDDFETTDNGRKAFFSARAGGKYVFVVAAAKEGVPFLEVKTLTVRGPPVIVNKLRSTMKGWLKPIEAPNKVETLKAMAGVFRKLADKPTTVDKMLEATALANSAVIGDNIAAWVPFLDKLGNKLDGLVDAKELETIGQYQKTWLEIADALEYNTKG